MTPLAPGSSVIRTLVAGELRGTIDIHRGEEKGTEAVLVFPLERR